MSEIRGEKEGQLLEIAELRAEVTLLQTRLRRAERSGESTTRDSSGSAGGLVSELAPRPPPAICISRADGVPAEHHESHSLRAEAPAFKLAETTSPVMRTPPSSVIPTPPTMASATPPTLVTATPPILVTEIPVPVTLPVEGTSVLPTVGFTTHSELVHPSGAARRPAPLPVPAPTTPHLRIPTAFPAAANILPQIPNFHGGEQKDGETFQDWREHFEAVAQLQARTSHNCSEECCQIFLPLLSSGTEK